MRRYGFADGQRHPPALLYARRTSCITVEGCNHFSPAMEDVRSIQGLMQSFISLHSVGTYGYTYAHTMHVHVYAVDAGLTYVRLRRYTRVLLRELPQPLLSCSRLLPLACCSGFVVTISSEPIVHGVRPQTEERVAYAWKLGSHKPGDK